MFDNSYFGIILSFAAYEIGKWINSKVKKPTCQSPPHSNPTNNWISSSNWHTL